MGHLIFQDILIIFLVSIPVVLLVHQFKLPAMIGFIATGALIGPFGIGLIHSQEEINILAEIGVTLLLFSVGLEFSFDTFAQLRRPSLISGIAQITLTIAVGTLIGKLLGWPTYRGIYFGCVLSLSSTALVFASLYHNRSIDSLAGMLSTAILIIQDIAFVPMMALLPLLRHGGDFGTEWQAFLFDSGKALLIIFMVTVSGILLAKRILRQILISRSRELFIITVIALALGMAWLTHHLGFSVALGAFLGGLMIGGTVYKYQALSEVSPLRYCFNSIFFVSIGMLLNFEFLRQNLLLVLALLIIIPMAKALITTMVTIMSGIPFRIAMAVGLSLGQIGEFSFLLAYTGQKMGAISPFFFQLIVAVSVVAMILTPLMVSQAPTIADAVSRLSFIRKWLSDEQSEKLTLTSQTLNNHVIICGFGPLGETFGRILKQHKIPYIVLELNPHVIERVSRKQEPVFFGDGASEEILYRCGIDRARMLAITVPDFLNTAAIIQQARHLNPKIRIFTRAKYRNQVEKLYDAGADAVISEELEGGIEMGRYALKELGLEEKEVNHFIDQVREFGSADFF